MCIKCDSTRAGSDTCEIMAFTGRTGSVFSGMMTDRPLDYSVTCTYISVVCVQKSMLELIKLVLHGRNLNFTGLFF